MHHNPALARQAGELRRRRTWISLARGVARRAGRALASTPGLTRLRYRILESDWRAGRNPDGNFGVYSSFEEALWAAPPSLIGYDHTEMADLGSTIDEQGNLAAMRSSEYPVLFWLRPALEQGALRLFDLGGYVGHAYYQYRDYLDFPADFAWTVHDLPAITRAGEEIARHRQAPQLSFTNDVLDADGADILLAAGSLQYMKEGHLHEVLGQVRRRPRHVIVQRTALHPERSFVTLQSIVTRNGKVVFCPYTVAHRQRFIDGMTALGYEHVDSWDNQRAIDVPMHPECHVDTYAGLYFRLQDDLRG